MLHDIWSWFLLNPARFMLLISVFVTLLTARLEWHGRLVAGAGGWLTFARLITGAIFSLLTAFVASLYGGISAFFGYLLLQLAITIWLPMQLAGWMGQRHAKLAREKQG